MPKGGLEPPRVTSHAPQTCASTSSATSAFEIKLLGLACTSTLNFHYKPYLFYCVGVGFACSAVAGDPVVVAVVVVVVVVAAVFAFALSAFVALAFAAVEAAPS